MQMQLKILYCDYQASLLISTVHMESANVTISLDGALRIPEYYPLPISCHPAHKCHFGNFAIGKQRTTKDTTNFTSILLLILFMIGTLQIGITCHTVVNWNHNECNAQRQDFFCLTIMRPWQLNIKPRLLWRLTKVKIGFGLPNLTS